MFFFLPFGILKEQAQVFFKIDIAIHFSDIQLQTKEISGLNSMVLTKIILYKGRVESPSTFNYLW